MKLDLNTKSLAGEGFFKIWKFSPVTGESSLLVSKPNTILYTGSDLLAELLGGQSNREISHLYLAYSNDDTLPAGSYSISKSSSTFTASGELGYLRVPLTFPASFTIDPAVASYENNIVVFTITVNNANSYKATGSHDLNSSSKFFEAALVAATNPAATVTPASHRISDKMFARVSFERIAYDSNFNLSISWGVKFTS